MGSHWITLIAIAVASNLDNAGVGIAYGVRRIRISWLANLVIAIISGLATWASGWLGRALVAYMPGRAAAWMGAVVMAAVGLWVMSEPWRSRRPSRPPRTVVARILRDPVTADFDGSQTISLLEALVLGVALAVNALVGGFDAGILQMGLVWVGAAVAVCSFLLLGLSAYVGRRYAAAWLGDKATYVAGVLLIVIALHQVW
ncbi:MAG: manganese efflux pump [Thermoflavifilum sp.]|nr:manganese efflux pump [Thermoflavifilum sp.]MCL6515128.1 manganese efflux pump [Alicyclobacillus sp.]